MEKIINEQVTVRGVKRTAGIIQRVLTDLKIKNWGQKNLQQAIVERKTIILGHQPTRRGRGGGQHAGNQDEASW